MTGKYSANISVIFSKKIFLVGPYFRSTGIYSACYGNIFDWGWKWLMKWVVADKMGGGLSFTLDAVVGGG